jgi:hypothetical protein
MKKLFTPPHFLGLFFVLMLFSCTKDDLENNATTSITNQLKNDLKLDQFSNKNISDNLVVNWEASSKIEKEDFEIYEIEANEKKPSTIESNLFQSKLKYELIAIKNGTVVHSYLVEAYSNLKHGLFPNSIQGLKNFTGTLNIFELNGKQIGQIVIINGNANTPSNDSSLDPLANAINLFYESKNTTNKIPACNQITTVPVIHEEWTDHFNVCTSPTGAYIGTFYMSTTYSSYTTYMSVAYDCDQAGDAYHILQRTSTYRDVVVYDKIDYTQLDPCSKAILEQIISGNSIKNIINQFAGSSSQFTWTLVTNDGSNFGNSNNIAETNWNNATENTYLTEIKSSYANTATRLSIARTIVHEAIHSYILSYLDSGIATFTSAFPELWDELVAKKYGDLNTAEGWNQYHHQEMARNYVTTIANALSVWDNNQNSNQYYIDLAWGGLIETDIFNQTTDLTAEDRIRIAESNKAEDLNNSNALSNPCN